MADYSGRVVGGRQLATKVCTLSASSPHKFGATHPPTYILWRFIFRRQASCLWNPLPWRSPFVANRVVRWHAVLISFRSHLIKERGSITHTQRPKTNARERYLTVTLDTPCHCQACLGGHDRGVVGHLAKVNVNWLELWTLARVILTIHYYLTVVLYTSLLPTWMHS